MVVQAQRFGPRADVGIAGQRTDDQPGRLGDGAGGGQVEPNGLCQRSGLEHHGGCKPHRHCGIELFPELRGGLYDRGGDLQGEPVPCQGGGGERPDQRAGGAGAAGGVGRQRDDGVRAGAGEPGGGCHLHGRQARVHGLGEQPGCEPADLCGAGRGGPVEAGAAGGEVAGTVIWCSGGGRGGDQSADGEFQSVIFLQEPDGGADGVLLPEPALLGGRLPANRSVPI